MSCGRDHNAGVEQYEEGGLAEPVCYGLTSTPVPHPSCIAQGEETEESGEEFNLGRMQMGARCFYFCFYFLLSYSVINCQKK